MKIEHKELGLEYELKDDLRQRDIEAFFKARRELGGDKNLSGPEHNGCVVRAAVRGEWVDGISEDDVDTMHPAAVTWLASEIQDAIGAAFEVPGE